MTSAVVIASKARPTVLLSYFALGDLRTLLDAVRQTGLATRAVVYVGSYGANPQAASLVFEDGRSYAPMLALRNIAPSPLPATTAGRVAAGREAGRQFRDQMHATGFPVGAWQFDELSRQVLASRPLREFTRGVLDGLLHGRVPEGDVRGFVWLARGAFGLPRLPIDAELNAFWHVLDAAASRIVGEEFPPFTGDPGAAARSEDEGRRGLEAGGPVRRSLATRYGCGITPGYRLAPGLGGNVDGRSRGFVNGWRQQFLSARRRAGISDFAVFNFRFGNASPIVMKDVLGAVTRVV